MPDNKKTFILCWFTYTCVYVCRVNISIAMPHIEKAYNGGTETLGLIGSVFFIVYATGQLINGFLGDRFPPKKFVAAALFGTALMNFTIGVTGNLIVMIVCWGLNGYFQSMIWGPLMKILSGLFKKTELRRVSAGMSCTMVIGYMVTWMGLGSIVRYVSWKWLFLLPFAVGASILTIWLIFVKPDGTSQNKPVKNKNIIDSIRYVGVRKLWFVVLSCFFLGMVKEGIALWAPILFTEAIGYDTSESLGVLMIIPIANLIGIFFAGKLNKRLGGNALTSLLVMVTVSLCCTLLLGVAFNVSKISMAVLISVISAMSNGCNMVTLSLIPLMHGRDNMVSTLVGIFDFSSYLGAASSALLTGLTVSALGWRFVPSIWLVAGLVTLFLLSMKKINESKHALIPAEKENVLSAD